MYIQKLIIHVNFLISFGDMQIKGDTNCAAHHLFM